MNNVRDFGAVGDGIVKDTAAVQRALDAGGTVVLPRGLYLCGTLYLRSSTVLHLEEGAVLRASPDPADYNADDFCPENRISVADRASGAHLIIGYRIDSLKVTGCGTIDGNSRVWINQPDPHPGKYPNYLLPAWRPSQLLFFCCCTNIELEQITIVDAPYWTCLFLGCDRVAVSNVNICNDPMGHNGDGIDIDCSSNVTVCDCKISGSDDCIAVRGCASRLEKNKICERISIRNCILNTNQAGIRVGVGDGLIRACHFSDIIIQRAAFGIVLCPRWYGGRGADIEQISFERICIQAERPFNITSRIVPNPEAVQCRNFIRSVRFRNVECSCNRSATVTACDGGFICGISFENIKMSLDGNEDEPWKIWYDANISAPAAFYLNQVSCISFKSIKLERTDAGRRSFPNPVVACSTSEIHGIEELFFTDSF